jgi:hypothetical protein
MGVVSQRPIIKLGQRRNAALNACANSGRPQYTVLPEFHSAFVALRKEVFHLRIRRARKEEQLVKIALPG